MWIYVLMALTLLSFISLHNIFEYFRKLMESCYQKVIANKDFSESFLQKETTISDWKRYKTKWRKLVIFLASIAVPIFIALMFFKKIQSIVFLVPFLGIILIGLITLDVNKIVKTSVTLLGSYDEFVKSKLGIEFRLSVKETGYCELSDEMTKNVKYFFK